jgi:hypothetical protein
MRAAAERTAAQPHGATAETVDRGTEYTRSDRSKNADALGRRAVMGWTPPVRGSRDYLGTGNQSGTLHRRSPCEQQRTIAVDLAENGF